MASRRVDIRPPSTWWLVVGAVIWALAAAALLGAAVHQRAATRPVGEWEVFVEDLDVVAGHLDLHDTEGEAIRHTRNQLEIEAVSVVDPSGTIVTSTSGTLEGRPVSDDMLASGVESGRFAGLAGATADPIEVDGVVEWPAGSVLYQVISPVDTGPGFALLHYDVAQLLERRNQPGDIQSLTLQLIALGGVFAILGTVVFVGHARAARRQREMAAESALLRDHSEELEEANAQLAEARRSAEQALALAEEKMRIRSEFVLMINHELRTPLTSVVTGAELLRDGGLGLDEQHDLLESMIGNGRRLNEIIDQILAVARVENMGLTYALDAVPLDSVGEALGIGTAPDPARGVRPMVRTDPQTVALVVSSLVDNARTHGASRAVVSWRAGPLPAPMLVIGRQPEPAVFLEVSDDGPGIDPVFLPRAFEKFEKNSFSSGTGVGLYLVRLMVEALEGSIAVATSPSGTTFSLALPAVATDRVMETV